MAHAARPLGGRARNPSPGPARPPPPFAAADAAAAAGLRDAPRRVARMKVIIGADSAFLVFFFTPNISGDRGCFIKVFYRRCFAAWNSWLRVRFAYVLLCSR